MDGAVNPRSPLDLKPDPDVLMGHHSMHHYGQSGGSMMAPPSPELMAGGTMVRTAINLTELIMSIIFLFEPCIMSYEFGSFLSLIVDIL